MSRFLPWAIAIASPLIVVPAQAQMPSQSAPSQSAECGSLLNLATQTGRELGGVFQTATEPGTIFGQVATITATTAATYEAMAIADVQLQEFQAQFVEVYTTISAVSQRLNDAELADDQPGIQVAYEEFRVAIRPERALIRETISYCFPQSEPSTPE